MSFFNGKPPVIKVTAASPPAQEQDPSRLPYKKLKTLAQRKEEVARISYQYPNKIPIILERYRKEKNLAFMSKVKFLAPEELTMSQFMTIIRGRMSLAPNQSFYLLINNRSIASMSTPLFEIYREYKDEDGFMYMTYASHEVFG